MTRKFHFHPDRRQAVMDACLAGTLIASPEQLVEDKLIPLTESHDKPVLGWWMDVMEPKDWLVAPKVPDEVFEYGRALLRLAESLSGALPVRRHGIGPHREDYATQEAFDKARGVPVAIEDKL